MKKIIGIRVFGLMAFTSIVLASCSTLAATGASPEFRIDLRGLGPWERRTASANETLTYSSAWATNAAAGAKAVVKVMPVLKTKPKYLVIDLSGGTSATHYPISYLDEVPGGSWSDEYKTSKLVLRHIPAGSFIMGGRATDYPGAVNTNLHMVTITRDFYMGVFEVTQRQWELVMGTRPSKFSNDEYYATRPVEQVSYADVRGNVDGVKWPDIDKVDEMSFLGILCSKTGLVGVDLPTEAQWELACRSGNSSALGIRKNLTSKDVCPEVDAVARYRGNSNWPEEWDESIFASGTNVATAAVGSYLPNHFGLYDMHGNVFEFCKDVWNAEAIGSVDPVGASSAHSAYRVYRGGSFWHVAAKACSGNRNEADMLKTQKYLTVGFRLCLQGGDVPDFVAASTLVNVSGTGSQSWTPTMAGAYYLTHSTMNGATNVQLLSAWFEVPGCELALEPQGELTNGVMMAINGATAEWTVYYTTNGLAPSTASEKYTGPFSLPESATVRAVAYNAQGVASEETTTSFTLHDAHSVVGAIARPRYPWNGMVDIDCEIKGDPEAKYDVELVVKDLEGGTNLVVRTVTLGRANTPGSPQSQQNEIALGDDCGAAGVRALPPGKHRLTWNADADIPHDGDFPRVAVTVKATKQSVLAGYARQFTISTDGYAGAETLTGVPVLVRLSTSIDGFDYRDFASSSNGADLAFFDANEQPLPYEIDEWHINGESLVWVKLPTLKKGTRFTCAYGNNAQLSTPNSQLSAQHAVWADYAGVWHMNEDSGTAFDSTEHGLDALPSCGTNKLADISQMVAYENGACGRARVNGTVTTDGVNGGGNYMLVPSYDSLFDADKFIISDWIHANQAMHNPRLWSRKATYKDQNGWEVELNDSPTKMLARGSYGEDDKQFEANCIIPSVVDGWVQLVVDYQGEIVTVYTNGALDVSTNIVAVNANGRNLSFGCDADGDETSLNGQYDEIRLRGGSLSADRIKADYDMIAKRDFCTYGAVKGGVGE